MEGGPVCDKARTTSALGDVVVLAVIERLDLIRPGLDGGSFDVGGGIGMMRLDQAALVEETPNWPFLKSTRISGAVRLWLSVSTSTITGTLCGA